MTGIVLSQDDHGTYNDSISLEYVYIRHDDIINATEGVYDWTVVEEALDDIASRSHQAVLRFYYTLPGRTDTAVPGFIKALESYNEYTGESEGRTTTFPDWTSSDLEQFTLDFFTAFAALYDDDPRLAFLETGFGLWGEYHIYDFTASNPGYTGDFIGGVFPSHAFQKTYIEHMAATFQTLKWCVSIDAADSFYTPFADNSDLLELEFGLFDDSFLHETHHEYNEDCFNFFDRARYEVAPAGGELNFYTSHDQEAALDPTGPWGISYETASADFHITYMLGMNQPLYQTAARIKEASLANGYQFRITSFRASDDYSEVVVENIGVAPIYYDAFVMVNGMRSSNSLKGLLPLATRQFIIATGGANPTLTIESDHLVDGQEIEIEAALE